LVGNRRNDNRFIDIWSSLRMGEADRVRPNRQVDSETEFFRDTPQDFPLLSRH